MLRLLLLLSLYIVTSGLQGCKLKQKLVMKDQWAQAFKTQKNGTTSIGEVIWMRIFDVNEDMEEFYMKSTGNTKSFEDFQRFADKVIASFDMAMSLLEDDHVLMHHLEQIRVYHKGKSIPPRYYDILLHTMMEVVSEINKSPVDQDAWHDCGTYIMTAMQDTEQPLS